MSDARLFIIGLGPAGLDRLTGRARDVLDSPGMTVIARTESHPAVVELSEHRPVRHCDDLYDREAAIEDVYQAIADRVLDSAQRGPTVYAVPGSALVGERAVALTRAGAAARGIVTSVIPGESFLDLVYLETGIDPIGRPVKIIDARDLPDPLVFDAALVITQVDRPEVLADLTATLGRVLEDETPVCFLDRLGDEDQRVIRTTLGEVARLDPGPRTTLMVDAPPAGWFGLVTTNRILRNECPWDREQTHHSLVRHLIEETYETVEAIRGLSPQAPGGEVDFGAYAELEEELGDLLLQVVFHATLARETGAFDVEEIAELVRRKLVRRHPHVFGDGDAEDTATVLVNWERLKEDEKQRASLMDDIPRAAPSLARAEKMQRRVRSVGFDWENAAPVFDKVREELAELAAAGPDPAAVLAEIGDVLFSVVNLARHVGVDPELALGDACNRFAGRIRAMEQEATSTGKPLGDHSPAELDELWQHAKNRHG